MEPVITILHAEDDALLRRSTATDLNNLGFRVLEAEKGLEAWEIFQQQRPDLVLTDLRMPVIDGFELLAKVIAESPDTPITILSGMGTMTDVIEALHFKRREILPSTPRRNCLRDAEAYYSEDNILQTMQKAGEERSSQGVTLTLWTLDSI